MSEVIEALSFFVTVTLFSTKKHVRKSPLFLWTPGRVGKGAIRRVLYMLDKYVQRSYLCVCNGRGGDGRGRMISFWKIAFTDNFFKLLENRACTVVVVPYRANFLSYAVGGKEERAG